MEVEAGAKRGKKKWESLNFCNYLTTNCLPSLESIRVLGWAGMGGLSLCVAGANKILSQTG